jgi:allantoate deiminase
MLGSYSEEDGQLTRRFATPMMSKANDVVSAWMQATGMSVRRDAVGNLIGRYEATSAGAKTLLLGSHLDTVRNAGMYDGPLGVLVALACIERLHTRRERLPFALEIIAFADEEGLRYHYAYIGSKATTGTFDTVALDLTDTDGISMRDAILAFGGNPDALHRVNWQAEELVGYCEVHIEQGPVLEAHHLPIGIVSAITGHNRAVVSFEGQAGHAGTVPMQLRHDALCAAAEFTLAAETLARAYPGAVATVGQLEVQPGASNVIPGRVTLSLDVRHQDDTLREAVYQQLQRQAQDICAKREVTFQWQAIQETHSVQCDPQLISLLERAIQETNYPLLVLPSGAGHDGVPMSHLTSVAMLFVRCRGGVSHHPAESVNEEDVAVAVEVLERFLHLLAQKVM